jgi:acyl-CoA thioesterase-1
MVFLNLVIFLVFYTPLPGSCASPKQILFLGDSITAGYGVRAQEAFPQLLNVLLQNNTPKVHIVNGAESGSLSSSALSKLKWYLPRIHPDLVILTLGGNDAREGRPIQEISDNLRTALQFAKDQHLQVLIGGMRIFPNLGKVYAREFAHLYKKLAEDFHVRLVPFVLQGVAGVKEMNQADGFHPNAKGHQQIAKTLLPYIKKAL